MTDDDKPKIREELWDIIIIKLLAKGIEEWQKGECSRDFWGYRTKLATCRNGDYRVSLYRTDNDRGPDYTILRLDLPDGSMEHYYKADKLYSHVYGLMKAQEKHKEHLADAKKQNCINDLEEQLKSLSTQQ